ncbi:DUF5131 family protein [Streptomyces avermitilis]|uniref:DUF5131 family protein n=1 Tax=Streptomyces avermitilis TaxID=33903 RepID=UPI0033B2279C
MTSSHGRKSRARERAAARVPRTLPPTRAPSTSTTPARPTRTSSRPSPSGGEWKPRRTCELRPGWSARAALFEPLRWRRPRKVFVNSMSDIGHARVPTEFVARAFATMALAPQHQFQVLTKKPRRLRRLLESQKFVDAVWTEMERLSEDDAVPLARPVREDVRKRAANWNALSSWPLPNVWIGTSIESDEYCWRADELRGIPAAVRFLSLEPLLGPVPSLELSRIDWVIVGGESGPAHRALDLAWVRDIRDQCVDLRVALFFKQVGGLTSKAGCRLLDGRTWDEYPATADVVGV